MAAARYKSGQRFVCRQHLPKLIIWNRGDDYRPEQVCTFFVNFTWRTCKKIEHTLSCDNAVQVIVYRLLDTPTNAEPLDLPVQPWAPT